MSFMGDISQTAAANITAAGDITLGGSNSFTGNPTLRAGRIVLDYGAGGGKNASKLPDAGTLFLGGGNTEVVLAGGSHEEIVGVTTLNNGAIYLRQSGGSSTLRMNSLTFNAGSALDFRSASIASTDSTNTNGILSGRATVGGTSWAINSTNGGDGAVTALASFATTFSSGTTNVDVTATASPTAFIANTVRFNTAGSQTLTLTGSNRLVSGGLLVTRNVGNGTTLITGGTLVPTAQMVIHQQNPSGKLEIASNIDMTQGLVKTGSGTVRFSNATSNTGAGAVSIHEGTVEFANAGNLGTGAIRFGSGTISNATGGTLTIPNAMTLGPDSDNGFRATVAFAGDPGEIVLGGAMTLAGSSSGSQVSRNLFVNVTSGVTVSATNATAWSSPNTAFTKIGSGTFSVRGSNFATNTQGPLVVREGVMDFSVNGSMTSGNAVLYGGTLQFDNTTTSVNARAGGSNYHLAGGEMKLIGNASVATTSTTSGGPLYMQPGASVVTVESKGQPTTLTVGTRIGSWSQTTASDGMIGATALVRGTVLGSGSTGQVGRLVGNVATDAAVNGYSLVNTNGVRTTAAAIVPWMLADDSATGSGKTFAMYDYPGATTPGNGFRPLYLTGGTAEVATAAGSTQVNYYFSGSGTTTASTGTWSSLQLDSGRTLAASSGTVTITMSVSGNSSGALLSTGAANTIDTSIRLDAGNNNFYVHTVSDLAIQGAITNGSGAFVKSSSGTLTVSGTSNRSTGNTFVNQGTLRISRSNALYDMSTFSGTAQANRVITVFGRVGSDAGVLELNGVNWSTGTSTAPGIVLSGNNATLRGSGTSSYGNGGFAYLSAFGDVFLDASGAGSVLTLNSPISRDSGLATTINVKGPGKVELGASAGNSTLGTSRGNAEMDWYIGGSRNGNQGWLAVNASSTVGVSSNSVYVANGGTLSGTGTLGSPTFVQSGGIISPGNSPGIETFASGLTFESGGQYTWEINNWVTGTAGVNFDQIAVTGSTLNITATSGSTFTIAITSLNADNAAGAVNGFNNGLTGRSYVIATGTITGYDPKVFTLGTSAFFQANTVSGSANGGFWLSTNTGSTQLILNYAPSALYTLSATPSASAIYAGGSVTVTGSIANSSADRTGADAMQFSNFSVGQGTLSVTSGSLATGSGTAGSVSVTLNTAGVQTFTPTVTATNVNLGTAATQGAVTSGSVSVWNPAAVNAITSPVSVGNVRVSGTFGTSALTITNTAAVSAYTEVLGASAVTSGLASASGVVTGLVGGSTSTALAVGLGGSTNTGSVGAKSGTATISFTSTGGPGTAVISSQNVAVSGTVFNPASANTLSAVSLGNVYAGGAFGTGTLSIWNTGTADASFQEGLSAIGTGFSGDATVSGSVTNLLITAGTSTAMSVGLSDASTAGVRTGTVTLGFTSTGTTNAGATGLSPLTLASQTVAVSGTVWNPAGVNSISAPTIGNVRVGGTFANASLTITNTAAAGAYTEVLSATAATSGLASSSGVVTGLVGGSTSTALAVGLGGSTNTGSAGVKTGTATISFTSTGGPGTASITSQDVVVSGTVFNAAAPNTLTTPLNLGAVLKSSTVAQALAISNIAPSGFTEGLDAQFAGTTGAATTNSGSISLLTAGSTNSTAMVVGLNTSTLGVVSGSVQVNFWTNGEGTSGLAPLQLAPQTLALSGTVLDRATPSFTSGSTTPFLVLDFGTLSQNASATPLNFSLFNLGTSAFTADLALFNIDTALAPFTELSANLATFFNLGVEQSNPYLASFSTITEGVFENVYKLQFRSASGNTAFADDPMQEMTLTLRGTVVAAVPEPGTLALVGVGGAVLALRRMRRRRNAA